MVVEFFAAVGIADISPAVGSHGMIVLAEGRDGDAGTSCIRINQQSTNRLALDVHRNRNISQITQRRIDGHEVNRTLANSTGCGCTGSNPDQWCTSRFFPQSKLSPVFFFAEMPAMVSPQADDRVVFVGRFFQCIQYSANLPVEITNRSQISLHGFFPSAGFQHSRMIAGRFRHLQPGCRNICKIAVFGWW